MNEVTIKAKRRPNCEIVLRALHNGQEIEFPDGYVYSIIDNKLCFRIYIWKDHIHDGEPDEIRWLEDNLSLNKFLEYCNVLPDKQIISLAANNALMGMKKDR